MTKKICASLMLAAAFCGMVRAADSSSEILIATPIGPAGTFRLAESPVPSYLVMDTPTPVSAPSLASPSLAIQGLVPSFRPSISFGKGFFEANLIAMVGLNIADYFSTRQALKYPGLQETNPLMKPFVKSPAAFAAVKIGTTALTYWSFKALFKHNRTLAWIMTTASNALLSVVVANNLSHIQQARLRQGSPL